MSTELVTAHAGQNHVDSADIGELYAGAFGSGRYALDVGERLSVGMTDANTLHIGTGGFIFDGRWVRVTGSGEDIKIANGGQGMFRKDLVAYVYSRDPSSGNIESGSWVVVQGEPASTEAAATAPAIDEGSILDGDLKASCAVAEVDVAGLTPTAKLLLPCVASLKAVGDSVSHAVVTAPANGVTCVSIGRIVIVQLKNISLTGHTGRTVCKLPFKPVTEVIGCLNVDSASGYVKIDTNGAVFCFSATSGNFSGQAVICA